jgi:hypothetical protein
MLLAEALRAGQQSKLHLGKLRTLEPNTSIVNKKAEGRRQKAESRKQKTLLEDRASLSVGGTGT